MAHGILLRVSREGAWASRLLEAIDEDRLDPRDRALIQEIVLGTLRWRGLIDACLGELCARPLSRLEPPVLEALRIGAYQILFLDRIPAHAAVGESVEIVRAHRGAGRGAEGLVNAVLRRLADRKGSRARPRVSGPGGGDTQGVAGKGVDRPGGEGPGGLAARVSHPAWIVERARARFGDEAEASLLANNAPAPVMLRPNPLHPAAAELGARLLAEGVTTAPGSFAPGSLRVLEGHAARTRLFTEGAFWIQDEASQIVPLLFPPPWDGLSADLCAAPGGKSFVLASGAAPSATGSAAPRPSARGKATVIAFDLHLHRARRLLEAAERIAPGRIVAVVADMASAPPAAPHAFDRILVDAPCSGTGVLRRHPEIRWRLEPGDLDGLPALQGRLLDAAVRLLRPGGWIVYSVCSIEPEEGDAVLNAFLERSGCRSIDPRGHVPESVRSLIGEDGRLRTFTHRHGCDGFFAALVRGPEAIG